MFESLEYIPNDISEYKIFEVTKGIMFENEVGVRESLIPLIQHLGLPVLKQDYS